jgi:RNA polymerase subunit RPABC4/transcription elongation factor Spt4
MGYPWKPDFTGEQFCSRCLKGSSSMHWISLPLIHNFSSDTADASKYNGSVICTMQGPFCPDCYNELTKFENEYCPECGQQKPMTKYIWKYKGEQWYTSYSYKGTAMT